MKITLCLILMSLHQYANFAQSFSVENTENIFLPAAQNGKIHSPFDAIGNSAVLTKEKGSYWGVSAINSFMLKELTQTTLAVDYLGHHCSTGIWITHFGIGSYSRNEFNIWFSKRLSSNAALGLTFHERNYVFGDGKSCSQLAASIGGQISFAPACSVGISIIDLASAIIGDAVKYEPGAAKIGLCYSLSNETDLFADVYNIKGKPPGLCFALGHHVSNAVKIFGGYEISTRQFYFSIGVKYKKIVTSFQFQYHSMLGISPGLALSNQSF